MNLALMTVVLALGWAAATGNFSLLNLIFGAIISIVALFLIRDRMAGPRITRRARRIFSLGVLFLFELFLSAVKVAVLVLRPSMHRRVTPGIVAFPLRVTRDAEITLLANMITLTPGTLSVDVSEDRRHLFIHVLSMTGRDEVISSIANGFEAKIMEAFR